MPVSHQINSKRKGSKNERMVAKLFEKWTGYPFTRTPSSGGLRWKQRTSDTVGDIICADDKHVRRFKFSIEAKFHREIDFKPLIGKLIRSDVMDWWKQALADGERSGKVPLLFMRYNNMARGVHFVIMPTPFFLTLRGSGDVDFNPGDNCGAMQIHTKGYSFSLIDSRDLFSTDYKFVHKLAKTYLNGFKESE